MLIDCAYVVPVHTAGGTGTAITLTIAEYTDGLTIPFTASANNGGVATTINGKPLYVRDTTNAPTIVNGTVYRVKYNLANDCFYLKAKIERAYSYFFYANGTYGTYEGALTNITNSQFRTGYVRQTYRVFVEGVEADITQEDIDDLQAMVRAVADRHLTIEISSSQPVVCCRLLDQVSTDASSVTSHPVEFLKMFARLPLTENHNRKNLTSFNASYGQIKSVEIQGNGLDVAIEIHNKNLAVPDEIVIGYLLTTSGEEATSTTKIRTGFIPMCNNWNDATRRYSVPVTFTDTNILVVAAYFYDKNKNFLGTAVETCVPDGFMRRVYKYGEAGTTEITQAMLDDVKAHLLCEAEYVSSGIFEAGRVSRISIPAASLPVGTSLTMRNGAYQFYNGTTYTYVGDTLNTALTDLYVYDGINYVSNVNGQDIVIDY
jgi:hypothetical protein